LLAHTEAEPPMAAPATRWSTRTTLRVLLTLAFVTHVDLRILAPAVPSIARSLHATPGGVGLAMTSYALAFGAGQLLFGPLADRLGRVRIIRFAAIGFGLSAITSAFAQETWQFIAIRMLVGAFSGAIVPLTLAYIGDTHVYEKRQAAVARVAIVNSVAFALSAVIGGFVTQFVSWRVMLAGTGAVALLPGLLLFTYRSPTGSTAPAPSSPSDRWARYVGLLRQRRNLRVYSLIFLEGFLLWGAATYLGVFIQRRFGLDQLGTGALLAVMGVGTMVTGGLLGWLRRHLSENALVAMGGALLSTGFTLLIPRGSLLVCGIGLYLIGAGFIALVSTLQVRATELDSSARGTAMSLFALSRYLGVAVGTAALGRVFDAGFDKLMLTGVAMGLGLIGCAAALDQGKSGSAAVPPL
jgi:predicted MFS family arabinose efflux permease